MLAGARAKPSTARLSGSDPTSVVGARETSPNKGATADEDDEDDYVRLVSKPRASRLSSSGHTPARHQVDGGGASVNESTAGAAGSFMSAGDVENKLFVR